MKKDKKKLILSLLAILGLVVITVGVTYAFFTYAKEGTTENAVRTGTITFLYTETSGVGNGISISDAYPISDSQGKAQTGNGKVFDFKVTSTTMSDASIPYEVTARKKSTSTLDESAVKLYLTKVSGESEEEVLLDNYSDLTQTSKVSKDDYVEKTIYQGKVPANSTNYEQAFRLRMWIDETTDFSPNEDGTYPYNGKTFTVTVNVYANAKVVTEEDITLESNANISSLSVDGEELTLVTNQDYDYEVTLPIGTTKTSIDIETESPYAIVKLDNNDTLAYTNNIKRLSTSKEVELFPGDNYFKIIVTSEDKKITEDYYLKISVTSIIEGDSILSILNLNILNSGYHTFIVNSETYTVHLYSYNGNQLWDSNKIFGDSGDVATSSTNAKNMVIVKINGDLTVNSGITVSPYYTAYGGPKGFALYVTGTLTNNGTIDNSHGAKAAGQNVYLWKNEDETYEYVPATGATGGTNYSYKNTSSVDINIIYAGNTGKNGTNRQTGGGGSGAFNVVRALNFTVTSGAGGTGTSYSGGTGGGAISVNNRGIYTAGGGSSNGATGGRGIGTRVSTNVASRCAGGGAGNPGGNGMQNGTNSSNYKGANGTGGLLIVYANNYINNGTVSSIGSIGGSSNCTASGANTTGGSSGGGSINIFYQQLSEKGTESYSGGISTNNGSGKAGGAGGKGTITYTQISFE